MNSFGEKLMYGHNHEISLGYGKMIASNIILFLQVRQIYLISWAKHCYMEIIFLSELWPVHLAVSIK